MVGGLVVLARKRARPVARIIRLTQLRMTVCRVDVVVSWQGERAQPFPDV